MTDTPVNTSDVRVLRLQRKHMDPIVALMNREGWYYFDTHELQRYLDLDQTCFVLLKEDRVIGGLFTTSYGNQAWIGNIIVDKAFRGTGLASKMIRSATHHLHVDRRVQTFRLGSVPLAIGLYRRMGFHAEAFTTAQQADLPLDAGRGSTDLGADATVERLEARDMEAVARLDEQYFKSNRRPLLAALFHDSLEGGCVCLKDRGRLAGFLMVRCRQTSRAEARIAEGPDHVYRLGPCCVAPELGINGFKALFQTAIQAVNEQVRQQTGTAKIYCVFPRNPQREEIYGDTEDLARAMGMDWDLNLDRVFDEHDLIFGRQTSVKNDAQWQYMHDLGFRQEYFEQVMYYTPEQTGQQESSRLADQTRADTEGIFASATPGDKA